MFKNAYRDGNYYSVYRGIVEDNTDPENLGRCKIRVPDIHGRLTYPIDILPWARPISLYPINNYRGCTYIPDVGDIVWVLFEGGLKTYPVYFGGTYSTDDIKIVDDRIDFYIENEDRISYDRSVREFQIKIGDTILSVNPEKVTIEGNLEIKGNLTVTGDTTLNNLIRNESSTEE